MKAFTYHRFGPPEVLELTDLPKPMPREDEVLIKVRAVTVTAGDWRCRSRILPKGFSPLAGLFLGFGKPKHSILGTELSGEIEAVGNSAGRFRVGDEVFAFSFPEMGSYVEYKCMGADRAIEPKPASLSFEEAAALSFGGTTALGFFRKAGIKPGDEVLIVGASGGVGTAAVQLAKHFGAEVTGVCSAGNLELVKSLGADKAIDYAKEDFTKNGETYDIIVDNAGTAPFSKSKGSLKAGGRLLLILASLPDMLGAALAPMGSGKRVLAGSPGWRKEDLRTLADLAVAGRFKPFIDRTFPFEQMVEAHRYVDAGHKRGNVVVTL